jgi:hypothetical protein
MKDELGLSESTLAFPEMNMNAWNATPLICWSCEEDCGECNRTCLRCYGDCQGCYQTKSV